MSAGMPQNRKAGGHGAVSGRSSRRAPEKAGQSEQLGAPKRTQVQFPAPTDSSPLPITLVPEGPTPSSDQHLYSQEHTHNPEVTSLHVTVPEALPVGQDV